MKKKILKITAVVVAIVLVIVIGFVASLFLGNPVSKLLVTKNAKAYMAENYANTDYQMGEIKYEFVQGYYYVDIKSPTKIDGDFTLYYDYKGELHRDTYEEDVENKGNTAERIDRMYRDATDNVIKSAAFPFECDIAYGTVEFFTGDFPIEGENPEYAIDQKALVLNEFYNIYDIGKKAGHLIIYVADENVTVEHASEIMLQIKKIMDSAGVAFREIDFYLQTPDKPATDSIDVKNFAYSDIYEEGMEQRVKKVADETAAMYARLDGLKEQEIEKYQMESEKN